MPINADFFLDAAQKFQRLLGLLGFMPLVVLPQSFVSGRVHHNRFDRGRSDIQSDHEFRVVIVCPLRRRGSYLK
jgi:hypothetical protein